MKISTIQWNIGGGYRRDENSDANKSSSYNISDLDYIVQIIGRYNPDIVYLQETHANDSFSQVEFIANSLGYAYYFNDIYDHSHIEKGQGLGQGIISRFPIKGHQFQFFINPHLELTIASGEKWLTHNKGVSECILTIENDKQICAKTLHMVPFRKFDADPKSPELDHIMDDIQGKVFGNEESILLQGDFNLDGELLKDFFNYSYEEVRQANATTPAGKKYDHILYKGMKHDKSNVIDNVLTDHFPIYSEFN
jgi:hypothetical protein